MSAAVRPLREDEYPAFVARPKQFYVTDMVAAGVDEDVARAKSETDFRSLLPRGLESARKRGIPAVALDVFGGNGAARGLYRSLGYREIAVHMEKRV